MTADHATWLRNHARNDPDLTARTRSAIRHVTGQALGLGRIVAAVRALRRALEAEVDTRRTEHPDDITQALMAARVEDIARQLRRALGETPKEQG